VDNSNYQIKIVGPGLVIERVVEKEVAERASVIVLTGKSQLQENKYKEEPKDPVEKPLKDFLEECRAVRNPERIVAVGCYLKNFRKLQWFGRDEIIQVLEEAGEKVMRNFARDMAWAMKIGWMSKATTQKGKFYVTNQGEKAWRETFNVQEIEKTKWRGR
jgi:hypothetical protein